MNIDKFRNKYAKLVRNGMMDIDYTDPDQLSEFACTIANSLATFIFYSCDGNRAAIDECVIIMEEYIKDRLHTIERTETA